MTLYQRTGIDMWSIGCIAAELLLRVPFIQGTSDLDQLSKVMLQSAIGINFVRPLRHWARQQTRPGPMYANCPTMSNIASRLASH